jgi:hypothetical protein
MDSFIAVFAQSPAVPEVTLVPAVLTPALGQAFTLVATVAVGQGIPCGKVVIKQGNRVVGVGTVGAKGTFSIKLRYAKHGSYDLTASYQGNGDFAAASGSLTLTL